MPEWSADPSAEWIQLGFEEAVLSEFSFLTANLGFACVHSDPTLVRYKGNGVGVLVGLDPASFELNVNLTRLPPASRETFSIWELARLMKVPGVAENSIVQASTSERIGPAVAGLARLLESCGAAALRGDDTIFLQLRALQATESEEFLKSGRLAWARGELGPAWALRDYARVVQLLEPISDGLSASEQHKLEYARKQLRAPRDS